MYSVAFLGSWIEAASGQIVVRIAPIIRQTPTPDGSERFPGPTPPASDPRVSIGSTFSVEIWATNDGAPLNGLACAYADLFFDRTDLIDAVLPIQDSVLFPITGVTTTIDNVLGLVDDSGGCQGVPAINGLGVAEWVLVERISMTADVLGGPITVSLADAANLFAGVSLIGLIDNIDPANIEFQSRFFDVTTCSFDSDCDDSVGCTIDTCILGNCSNAPDDTLCNNGQFCDGVETCDALFDCQAGTPPVVDDGVGCTDDSCDEVNDAVVNAPNDTNCDDGLFCTGIETCDAVLGCQAGTVVDCDDWATCTNDLCDETSDSCVNDPVDCTPQDSECATFACDPLGAAGNCDDQTDAPDGTTCSNGLETCIGGVCSSCAMPAAVLGVASRYIQIIPDNSDPTTPVAFRVTNRCTSESGWVSLARVDYTESSVCRQGTPNAGQGCDPNATVPCGFGSTSIHCVVLSVVNVGLAGPTCDHAEFHTSGEWLGSGNKLVVTGELISPQTKFDVQAVCGSCGSLSVTAPVTAAECTWKYGDSTNDGQVTFAFDLLKMFLNTASAGFPFWTGDAPGYEVDTQGNHPSTPDQQVLFGSDIFPAFKATIAGGAEEWSGPICTAECPDP